MELGAAEVVFSQHTGQDNIKGHEVLIFRYANGSVQVPGPWKRGRPKGSTNKETDYQRSTKHKSVNSKFEFVNTTKQFKDIDKTSRTVIRKHVKLHKNSQKRRRYVSTTAQRGLENKDIEKKEETTFRSMLKFNLRQISGVDPFDKSPIKLEPYMHDLLLYFATTTWKHFYSLEEFAGCNPMAEYWLPLAFQDCALIHSFIGCADVYIHGYKTIKNSGRGLRHLHEAISIVNQRLVAGNEIMSGGTISVIAGIALLEKGAGRHDHWRVHMEGLKQLVDIGGGLEGLHSEPLILNKIYRADLYGSLDAAKSPCFDRPLPLLSEVSSTSLFQSGGFNAMQKLTSINRNIRSCIYHLEDAMLFWSEENDSPAETANFGTETNGVQKKKPTPAEAARVRYLLTDIQYTLVSRDFQGSSKDTRESQIIELCRLTLILYTLTILNERPASTAVGEQVTSTFRRVFTGLACHPHSSAQNPGRKSWMFPLPLDFCLWAMFLAATVVMSTESDMKNWLLASFSELVLSHNDEVFERQALRFRMSKYLWVSSIHNPRFQWLWSEISEMRRKKNQN